MRAFILILLAAMLLVQFTDALPRPKRSLLLRSGPLRLPRSTTPEEVVTEKDKVILYGLTELLAFGKDTVRSHKNFFDQIVKKAELSGLDLDKELQELKEFSKEADKMLEVDDDGKEKYIEDVFYLFEKSTDILEKYDLDDIKDPTDKQKTMGKLIEDNGLAFLYLDLIGRIGIMRQHFTTRFQAYVDSLTPTEKKKERKFVEWFDKFKNEHDTKKGIEALFEFFEAIDP